VKILVLNSGSSSLKFKLFKMLDESVICSGLIENIGARESLFSLSHQEHRINKKIAIQDHYEALCIVFDLLFEEGVLVDIAELYAVGHRVVHGGDKFYKATVVDESLIEELKSCIPLAPLHNPSNILGIEAVASKAKELTQVAVFDTAFHHTMPNHAAQYAIQASLYKEDKIKRYGFHGTSHSYVFKQSCKLLDSKTEATNIISLHLGNGASVCAIKNGKSIDTSMGMTPLEGLVMGTRSGDIDPSIIFYLHKTKGYSLEEIDLLLNKQSGLLGLCGENDMRMILQKAKEGNAYQLAIDIFVYRIKKYIGAYMAILERTDAIVFTGGIGENSEQIRELICEGLEGLGLYLDKDKNLNTSKKDLILSQTNSLVKLLLIHTDEEKEIAIQTKEVLKDLE